MIRPYYDASGITLYHGDCRDLLPNVHADVVLMDPPYNCGVNYGELTDDNLPWPAWCSWFDHIVSLCRATAPDVFSFLSQTAFRKYLRYGANKPAWFMEWNKPLSMSICAMPFMPHHEPIAYWGDAKRTKEGGARWGSDIITANVEVGLDRWNHPTPKPLLAMLQMVEKFDGVICDPFAGSGTTLAAAKMLDRRAVGVEIEERFCEVIARRLEQTTSQFRASHTQESLFTEATGS